MNKLASLFVFLSGCTGTLAATYYVATTGNDVADGSIGTPWLRITNSLPKIAGGDTLYIRTGTYREWIDNLIPAGSDFNTATTLSSYQGESVTLNPSTPTDTDILRLVTPTTKYIIVNGLVFDGSNLTNGGNCVKITYSTPGQPAHHIRFSNCTFKNAYNGMNVLTTSSEDYVPTYCEFTNCSNFGAAMVSLNDTPNKHGWYISTSSNTFDNCTTYSNLNLCFHFNNGRPSGNVVKNCNFPAHLSDYIGLYGGTNNFFYNNVFIGGNVGILVNPSDLCSNTFILNNTFVSNGVAMIIQNGAANAGNSLIANNIISDQISGAYGGIYIGNTASTAASIVISNNILAGSSLPGRVVDVAGGATVLNNLTNQSSIQFVSPGGGNFRLLDASPARNAAATLTYFTADHDGITRSAPWDAGAFEFGNIMNVGTLNKR